MKIDFARSGSGGRTGLQMTDDTTRARRLDVRLTAYTASFLLVFGFVFASHYLSPVRTPGDSRFALQISASFLDGEWGDVSDFEPIVSEINNGHVRPIGDHLLSFFPVGVTLLSAPFVALFRLVYPGFDDLLRQSSLGDVQAFIASIWIALATVILGVALKRRFGFPAAMWGMVAFAFGTSAWSTASRAMWQHAAFLPLVSLAILLLVDGEEHPRRIRYLGLVLALAYVVRPTAAVFIVVLTPYVARRFREQLGPFLAWAAIVAVPWIVYNIVFYEGLLPPYYSGGRLAGAGIASMLVGLAGNLVSPARGLFIFSPVLLLAMAGYVISLRSSSDRALNVSLGLIVVLHWIMVSSFDPWYGGFSFGPRMMVDVVPIFVFYLGHVLRNGSGAFGPLLHASFGLLLVFSIFVHSQGAFDSAVHGWNSTPTPVTEQESRLWDWSDLQFLRGVNVHPRR